MGLSRKHYYVLFALVLLTTIGCSIQETRLLKLTSETPLEEKRLLFPVGTGVDDLDLSSLEQEEAKEKLLNWAKDKLEEKLIIVYNETEKSIKVSDLGITLDMDKTWESVLANPGQKVSSILAIDYLKANEVIEEEFAFLNRSPVDATFKIENDQFLITPAVPGESINMDLFFQELKKESLGNLPKRLTLKSMVIPAAVTTESLQALAFEGVIAEYTTQYDVSDKNRTANLIKAAQKMDKTLLKPGDTFSFNETIGPRTAETGFKDAYIVINNEYVKGIGGGICQVSSTLYNVALLANLTIVERHPHALVVGYIPLGQDATVNYPNLDLKLRNDTHSYIYFRTKVENGKLTIKAFGKPIGEKVRLVKEIEKEIDYNTIRKLDPDLLPGTVIQQQKGSKGYIVKTWKIVTDANGKETKQLLSRDSYAPTHRILRIGAD